VVFERNNRTSSLVRQGLGQMAYNHPESSRKQEIREAC
jgi:hypothetical protein